MASKGFFNAFADVWMHEGVRTPMVDYCGALGHISPTDLGIKAAREALLRAGIAPTEIGSVITGNMAPGDFDQFFLPRHIGLYAGVPVAVPALMAQRECVHDGLQRVDAHARRSDHLAIIVYMGRHVDHGARGERLHADLQRGVIHGERRREFANHSGDLLFKVG